MKYLKLFNESISENPILNNNEIKNLVINNLTPMFNLLGIKHTCDSGYQEGKGTPKHYYDFYFDHWISSSALEKRFSDIPQKGFIPEKSQ